ncbi:sensor histidine kinase [Actinoplanes sp. URMC 104]|uniref:sensor histidine kinase n=1 Tax=Actinoplanes sp. URMC 104 TaxID=3423409 RepID=UPI003F195054
MFAGTVFLTVWAASGRATPVGQDQLPAWVSPMVTMISYGVAGAVLLDRRPDLPFGWLLSAVAVLLVVEVVVAFPAADAITGGDRGGLARWALTPLTFGFLPVAVQGLVNVRFPTGRPATRAGAWLEKAIVAGTVLVVLGGFLGGTMDGLVDGAASLAHPLTAGTVAGRAGDALVLLAPVVVLLGLVAGIGVVWRFIRSAGLQRQQLKWRAAGVVLALAMFPLAVTDGLGALGVLDAPVFVLTLAIPVMRYRLWAIDTILRRSIAYAVVTALLVVAYVAVAVAVSRIASARVAAPVAAAVVALSFAPVVRWAQRLVDGLFYGDRSDPYRTLRALGRRLSAMPHHDVLESLVQSIATSLRLPYVAVERPDGTLLAEHGVPGASRERWPLTYEQRCEGFLVASPRRGEDVFDDRDQALLSDVAEQVGVAVHAVGLTAELLVSRQRLVTAREEERRRLRRELHDGLGPVLTAVGLNLDAAQAGVGTDPAAARTHLGNARKATTQALGDLRRLVHDLRPPALDLGLAAALRVQIESLTAGSALSATVAAPELPELPAAVEVAVFRIAVEAVTNAVRHSGATRCEVCLSVTGDELTVRVHDDGASTRSWTPGVGMTAMWERAAELGGTLRAGPEATGGATVVATFPLARTDR